MGTKIIVPNFVPLFVPRKTLINKGVKSNWEQKYKNSILIVIIRIRYILDP